MVIWVSVSGDGLKNSGPIFRESSTELLSESRRGAEKIDEMGHNDLASSAKSIDFSIQDTNRW